MTLPACLSAELTAVDAECRFVEVILHGVGRLIHADGLRLWSETRPDTICLPFRKRIWLDVVACHALADVPGIRITRLRECDEMPTQ